jgi:hypothetical protein
MFTQRISLTQQDARIVSAFALQKLGTVAETADGRVYRYASNGAVALAAGLANVTPAAVANNLNLSVFANAPNGQRFVVVTNGATAITQGQYDGGFLVVNDGAGVGQVFRIAGTPAIAAGAQGTVQLEEAVSTPLTSATSKVSFQPSLFGNTVVYPGTTGAFNCNGTNNVPVAAGSFYWTQTAGVASVLSDGIITKGNGAVLTTNAVAGALIAEAATTTAERVGIAVEATVATKYYPVLLTLE